MRQEHFDLWREAIDDDADRVWNSIREDVAPPLRQAFGTRNRRNVQVWLLAAAVVLVAMLGTWNAILVRQLTDVRTSYLVAALGADTSATQLAMLHQLSGESLSTTVVEALQSLVRNSQDPNVQLAALDLLLDSHALSEEQAVNALLKQARHNAPFIEAAIRARSTRI